MALQMAIETSSGISLQNAYFKIENTSGNGETQNLIVCVYADQAARENDKSPIDQKYHSFPVSVDDGAPNFIKQGYESMKALPEYTSAIDV